MRRGAAFSPSSTSATTTSTSLKGPRPWTQRWQRPCAVFTCSIALVLSLTSSVLYWNYTETLGESPTKGVILDHWGKGSPNDEETRTLK